tara:strand:- start:3676 stop:4284 length:609 start_codon:yes stop_codon:yes gene_type:complete
MKASVDALTLTSTRTFLGGVAVMQVIAALRSKSTKGTAANALGAAVCVIAGQVYRTMERAAGGADLYELRSADWYVTTPLMLIELLVLMGASPRQNPAIFVYSIVSILITIWMGVKAHRNQSARGVRWFVAATLVFVAMLYAIFRSVDWSSETTMPAFFLGLWSLYPIAYWSRSDRWLSLLDLLTKGVFGIVVAERSFDLQR